MVEVSRAEHMRWCKERALAYVERGELQDGFASFASDVRKHPATADNEAITFLLGSEGLAAVLSDDAPRLRRFIEGFAE